MRSCPASSYTQKKNLGSFVFRMETLPRILTALSFEMAAFQVIEDIVCLIKSKEIIDYNLFLAVLDIEMEDGFNEIDLPTVLMLKLCDMEDETLLVSKVVDMYNLLESTPESVLRPYNQPFVTEKYEQ